MTSNRFSFLLLSKDTAHCRAAQKFLLDRTANVTVFEGHSPFDDTVLQWAGDYLISFLYPSVLPAELLSRARRAAINFHPGPPLYPGTGCYNFAIYEEADEYGVTCHHMVERVDSGGIIEVVRFPLLWTDTVSSLKERSSIHCLSLFCRIVPKLLAGEPLPSSDENWQRRLFTRKQLNALCRISPEMSEDEIRRRVRATYFPDAPGPHVDLAGYRFEFRDTHSEIAMNMRSQ